MKLDQKTRLAAYVSTAFGGAATHADIHVYEGPAISIGAGSVMLDLEGLQLEIDFSDRSFTGSAQFTWWTCCTSNGDPSCGWSDIAVQNDFYGSKILSAVGIEGISTVDFLPIGQAPQGSQTGFDSTQACFFTYQNISRCGDVSSVALGDCGDQKTLFLGFTAPREGSTVSGWIEIDRTPSGSFSITRWAYEDDGSLILTGEVPEERCVGDIDDDGAVDSADLGALLAAWGNCGSKGGCSADIDESGKVDAADLGLLVAAWGTCPDRPCTGVDCVSDDPCTLSACIDGICYTDDLQINECNPGECCIANGTPGCIDEACMEVVCQIIPDCCDVAWDDACVFFASISGCGCP